MYQLRHTLVMKTPEVELAAAAAVPPPSELEQSQEVDERAVTLLQDCYGDKLSAEDLADALDVALNPDKAMLLVLRPGELRCLWLRRQLEKTQSNAVI